MANISGNMSQLTENLASQMSNPQCSYLTGMYFGFGTAMKMFLYIVIIYSILTAVDKLAFQPFIDFLKKKIYNKKNKKIKN